LKSSDSSGFALTIEYLVAEAQIRAAAPAFSVRAVVLVDGGAVGPKVFGHCLTTPGIAAFHSFSVNNSLSPIYPILKIVSHLARQRFRFDLCSIKSLSGLSPSARIPLVLRPARRHGFAGRFSPLPKTCRNPPSQVLDSTTPEPDGFAFPETGNFGGDSEAGVGSRAAVPIEVKRSLYSRRTAAHRTRAFSSTL